MHFKKSILRCVQALIPEITMAENPNPDMNSTVRLPYYTGTLPGGALHSLSSVVEGGSHTDRVFLLSAAEAVNTSTGGPPSSLLSGGPLHRSRFVGCPWQHLCDF